VRKWRIAPLSLDSFIDIEVDREEEGFSIGKNGWDVTIVKIHGFCLVLAPVPSEAIALDVGAKGASR